MSSVREVENEGPTHFPNILQNKDASTRGKLCQGNAMTSELKWEASLIYTLDLRDSYGSCFLGISGSIGIQKYIIGHARYSI